MIYKLREEDKDSATEIEKRNPQWMSYEGESTDKLKQRMRSKSVDPSKFEEVTSNDEEE